MNGISSDELGREYDAVIVGAGPAGCTAARLLSRHMSVLLIERLFMPRVKPCGGMLVEETQELLKDLHPPPHIFANPKYIDVKYKDLGNGFEKSAGRKFGNVFREAFDNWMFRLLEGNGATISYPTYLKDFREKKDGVELKVVSRAKSHRIRAKYLIDAGGASSLVRRKLRGPAPTYLAVQKYCATAMDSSDFAYFLFDDTVSDWYGWIIPKQIYTVLGVAVKQGRENAVDSFFKKAEKLAKVKNYFETEGHLLTRITKKEDIFAGSGNVFLIGEAAGFVSPTFGEGISFAPRSAKALADSLLAGEGLEGYRMRAAPLVRELIVKLEKNRQFYDPAKRKEMLRGR